jgi:hypothetical protein
MTGVIEQLTIDPWHEQRSLPSHFVIAQTAEAVRWWRDTLGVGASRAGRHPLSSGARDERWK